MRRRRRFGAATTGRHDRYRRRHWNNRNEFARRNSRRMTSRINLFGIPLDNLTMADAVATVVRFAASEPPEPPRQVSFVNAACVNLSYRDPEYREILRTSDLNLIDGVGMRWAGRRAGTPVVENVNGTDLFPLLCRALSTSDPRSGAGLFLLGGRPGVAASVADWVTREFPVTKIAGHHHGYFVEQSDEEQAVLNEIRSSRARVLLVARGAPLQEKWIRRCLDATGVRVALGVGGLFDYYSGRIPRAPLWIRRRGCEWCYRLYREPIRLFPRYVLGNPLFLLRMLDRSKLIAK